MRYFGNIAKLIKEARLNHPKRYSQTELSEKLGYKNGQFISNIERGLCSVPVKSLSLLSDTLNIDPKELKEALLRDLDQTLDNYLEMGKQSQTANSQQAESSQTNSTSEYSGHSEIHASFGK